MLTPMERCSGDAAKGCPPPPGPALPIPALLGGSSGEVAAGSKARTSAAVRARQPGSEDSRKSWQAGSCTPDRDIAVDMPSSGPEDAGPERELSFAACPTQPGGEA
jgi:hypothetical protein